MLSQYAMYMCFIVAPFNVTIHGSTHYEFGDTLKLNCTSEGSSVLQYSWSRDTSGEDMFPAGAMINNNTIIIYNLSVSDGGRYTCTVSNEAGNFSFTTNVNVGGKIMLISSCIYYTYPVCTL